MKIATLHYSTGKGRKITLAVEESGGVYTLRRVNVPGGAHHEEWEESALVATERFVIGGGSSLTVEAP